MKPNSSTKVYIKVDSQEQQENTKNTRKTLKLIQGTAGDKENLVGRSRFKKDSKLAGDNDNKEYKHKKVVDKAMQTDGPTITESDLTSEEASAEYWRLLAEKREESLNDSLQENDRLKEHIDALEQENKICKEMLEESKLLVEVLQEMVEEPDSTKAEPDATKN